MAGTGSSSKKRKAPAKSATTPRKSTRNVVLEAVSESQGEKGYDSDGSQGDAVLEIRPIINETVLDKEFMTKHQLEEVLDLVKAQGWGHLFCDDVEVNEELVREFYQSLVVEDRGKLTLATFTINGETEALSHRDLASILMVPAFGFEEYVKTVWPAEIPRADVILRVGEDPNNSSNQGNALKLGIVRRTLHRLVCTSITPRMQRHGKISFLDFLLMDKILSKEQVNLPKLILRHMHYSKNNPVHGLPYPGIVKQMLIHLSMYKFSNEKTASSKLNMETYEKLSWRYDDGKGWSYIRGSAEQFQDDEDLPSAKAGIKVKVEENSVHEALLQIVQKLESIEKLLFSALAHDSVDRINLTAATEQNTRVLTAVLKTIEKEKERKAAAAVAKEKEKAIVAAGPVSDVPVEDQRPPVMP